MPEVMFLSDAAFELGVSYNVALRLLLTHELRGGRSAAGRYVVERASVQKAARERKSARQPEPVAGGAA